MASGRRKPDANESVIAERARGLNELMDCFRHFELPQAPKVRR